MFPINEDLKFYECAVPDTNFDSGSGTISGANVTLLNNKIYQVAAFGVGLHGFNYNNFVYNYKDFASMKSYTGFTLITAEDTGNTVKAWNGTAYQTIPRYGTTTQISGYRSGDFRIIEVPNFNATRKAISVDSDKNMNVSFKKYAAVSGITSFVMGKELGRNKFICSFGVGKTFLVELNGSSASIGTTTPRKINFTFRPYGVISSGGSTISVSVNTNTFDFQNNTTALLTTACPNNAVYVATILDVSKSGNKCLIGITAQDSTVDLTLFDNDGNDYVNSYPFAFCEVVFTYSSGTITGSYSLVANNKGVVNSTASFNIINYFNGGENLVEDIAGDKIIWLQGGDSRLPQTVYGLFKYITLVPGATYPPAQVNANINASCGYAMIGHGTLPDINVNYDDSLAVNVLSGAIGYYNWVSLPSVNWNRHLFHICYDANDTIKKCWFEMKKFTGGSRRKYDISISGSISYQTKTPDFPNNNSRIYNSSGSSMYVLKTTTISNDNSLSYALYIDDVEIDRIEFLGNNNMVTTETTATRIYSPLTSPSTGLTGLNYTDSSTPITTVPNQGSKSTSFPGIDIYSFFGISSVLPFKSGPVMDGYYVLNTPYNGCSQIMPFCRIETNKLISFNIGLKDFSIQRVVKQSGSYGLFLIRTLGGSVHPYKAIYNMMDGSLINPQVDGHISPNPAFGVSTSAFYSCFNYKTNEVIINKTSPIAYI